MRPQKFIIKGIRMEIISFFNFILGFRSLREREKKINNVILYCRKYSRFIYRLMNTYTSSL